VRGREEQWVSSLAFSLEGRKEATPTKQNTKKLEVTKLARQTKSPGKT